MSFEACRHVSPRISIITAVLCALILSGCVTPIPLSEETPDVSYKSTLPMVISVIDDREYLKEGKEPTYIGRGHGLYGIPFDMQTWGWFISDKTKKKQPLAEALEERIVEGLNDEGWQLVPAGITKRPSKEESISLIAANHAERLLILTLTNWWVNVNVNWVSDFDFEWGYIVELLNPGGNVVVNTSDSGTDVIDEKASESHQNMIKMAFRERLIQILEQPELKAALTGTSRTQIVSVPAKPRAEKTTNHINSQLREVDAAEKSVCELIASINRSSGGSGDTAIYIDQAMNLAIAEAENKGADAYYVINIERTNSGASVALDALKCN